MELPLIGFVSIQGAILFLLLLVLLLYGYYAGLNKMLSPLFITIVALSVALIPRLHGWVSENISLVFSKESRYAAYLLIFLLMFFILRFIFKSLPRVVELDLPKQLDKAFGAFAGLVLGFISSSLFLIIIYGWKIPVNGLYAKSAIASAICKIWAQTSLLPELHSILYSNPITLI